MVYAFCETCGKKKKLIRHPPDFHYGFAIPERWWVFKKDKIYCSLKCVNKREEK